MTPAKIRILLVDDHAIVRHGYRTLLEKQPDMEVVGEAVDAADAYARYQEAGARRGHHGYFAAWSKWA